ncbi:MobF family relaxase [Jatrophihabitans lederbergiae]|uniref:MobF family relaxase n=1 Tax=Jatrophihabitans lederbergiae TaxID=3075547 RepID=A0ABU2JGH1_9ACTN|nr:MobF family relaxase [Jatrophihabitans sp. DSM 44399]MDT0264078.1 MobF family relaxase [Jatrophihabitans sp. DSM 44399]
MTLHKLSAGNGYTYLIKQVAANDAPAVGYANLAEYYSERGESPGRWLGRGLAGLEHAPAVGDRVYEEQMVALFGHGRHPNADITEQHAVVTGTITETGLGQPFKVVAGHTVFRRALATRIANHNVTNGQPALARIEASVRAQLRTDLGRELFEREHTRPPRDSRELADYLTTETRQGNPSVAGFDLCFSPVKSVSALWALADPQLAAQIEAAHTAAVQDVISWLEDTAVYTRLGHNGARQVDVNGLLAVAFVHRDSRAADPDLHTHVAISNKVQISDGRWRALDGRVLYKASVSASERYNTRLEAHLVDRLGVRFADRPGQRDKRPVREIVGMDAGLLQHWSTRRRQIEAQHQELAKTFTEQRGRWPDAGEDHELFDRANLDTRPDKHGPRSLDQQRATWRSEAVAVLGSDDAVRAMLTEVATAPRSAAPPTGWEALAAQQAVDEVSTRYATWQSHHVRAEVERIARADRVPLTELNERVEAAVSFALSDRVSIALGQREDGLCEPAELRRRDGNSVFSVAGAKLYTSSRVLDAEARLLDAARRVDGRRISEQVVKLSLLEAQLQDRPVNGTQAELIRDFATSGRRVQLALAAAGTGKTTALGLLAQAWREEGGTVVGLAPSAAAAAQLRAALGGMTDTVAKLLDGLDRGVLFPGLAAINQRTLVIVDEAAQSSTLDLDLVVAHALSVGASVRLVGDDRQLASIKSGGVLRDIARTVGAATLEAPVRFNDPTEGLASLALRRGEPVALGYYLDHDRVHAGDHGSVVNDAVEAWKSAGSDGGKPLLLAASRQVVRELNERVRADRLAGHHATAKMRLHDGTNASVGDLIVTRKNNRRLPITATDWVKNGDRWQVDNVGTDGSLQVTHLATRRTVQLPAAYVRESVELGYATTIHLAQGSTADTCHTVLTGRESREDLYVAMTRGRRGNHLYLDMSTSDPHDATAPDAVHPPTSIEILDRILARESSHRSATTQHGLDADVGRQLHQAVERYREAVRTAPGTPASGPGPLPWLEAGPIVDDDVWVDYLAARSSLVTELAARVDGHDLPTQTWSSALRQAAPELAAEVAIWRAASGCSSDPTPYGPADCEAPAYRRDLAARVGAVVSAELLPEDRWRGVAEALDLRLCHDPQWPRLARAIDDAARVGYDVETRLPKLLYDGPLPAEHAVRLLTYRLARDCPESLRWPPTPPGAHKDTRTLRHIQPAEYVPAQPTSSRGPRR